MSPGWLPKVSAKQHFLSVLLGNSPSQTSMSQTPVTHWLRLMENSYFTFSAIRATLYHSIHNGMTILPKSAASPTSWNQISPVRYRNNARLKSPCNLGITKNIPKFHNYKRSLNIFNIGMSERIQ